MSVRTSELVLFLFKFASNSVCLLQTANPTEVTLPSDNRKAAKAPPSLSESVADASVSLFGYSSSFSGLGVILDSAPSSPLLPYSRSQSGSQDSKTVADQYGAVSGIVDDGNVGNWIDDPSSSTSSSKQALYLEDTIGECQAWFRNNQGLAWVRIAHFDGKIRVRISESLC
jgi:hypothetical protein